MGPKRLHAKEMEPCGHCLDPLTATSLYLAFKIWENGVPAFCSFIEVQELRFFLLQKGFWSLYLISSQRGCLLSVVFVVSFQDKAEGECSLTRSPSTTQPVGFGGGPCSCLLSD